MLIAPQKNCLINCNHKNKIKKYEILVCNYDSILQEFLKKNFYYLIARGEFFLLKSLIFTYNLYLFSSIIFLTRLAYIPWSSCNNLIYILIILFSRYDIRIKIFKNYIPCRPKNQHILVVILQVFDLYRLKSYLSIILFFVYLK